MALGDHGGSAVPSAEGPAEPSHWERWHVAYEDQASSLSLRLRTVQAMVRRVLNGFPPDHGVPIRLVSFCAGQGRDVIDVVARHPRRAEVSALLVELDPALVAFARARADASGVGDVVQIVEGDASLSRWYQDQVPADLILVCGVFGNISSADITATIEALPSFCRKGSHVVWTRHRRAPDATPAVRSCFAAAGFSEVAFEAPGGTVTTVGLHRFDGEAGPFDPGRRLFAFVGDGSLPA